MIELSDEDRAKVKALWEFKVPSEYEVYAAGIEAGLERGAQECEREFVNEADLIPTVAAHNAGYNEACHDCAAAIRALKASA